MTSFRIKSTKNGFTLVDDYLIGYDGSYFDLHKPSDIRSLVTVIRYVTDENEQLKRKNKFLKNQYERKDRQLHRTKKDIEKYTDYFMNELNWDCERIIKEVFK